MRKQIRRADTSLNLWLPGFEPPATAPETRPSFDLVARVELPDPPNGPRKDSTPPSPPPPLSPLSSTTSSTTPVDKQPEVLPLTQALSSPVVVPQVAQCEKKVGYAFPTDFNFAEGAIERFIANTSAIQTLQDLAKETRKPNDEEQGLLARYSGWGGLSEVFGATTGSWLQRKDSLQRLITEDEFESARSSVLNAHYTEPTIARWMFDCIERLGFRGGRILDPCTGIGHFLGSMSKELQANCELTAIEPDKLSSEIARTLYPNAMVRTSLLETSKLPDNHFDVVISNVPFGEYTVADQQLKGKPRLIHDYFFEKAAALVRPGGLIAFITSTGTMDKLSKSVRSRLRSMCDLVAAFRLPATAFQRLASTAVTSDVIFLRKRCEGEKASDVHWLDTAEFTAPYGRTIQVNEYFVDNPRAILGEMSIEDRGRRQLVRVMSEQPLSELLAAAMNHLPVGLYQDRDASSTSRVIRNTVSLDTSHKANSYSVINGALCKVSSNGDTADVVTGVGSKTEKRIIGLVGIRDAMKQVLKSQIENDDTESINKALKHLNRTYDAFVSKFGIIHDKQNRRAFKGDPDLPSLLALEDYDDEAGTAKKMPIFERRTIRPATVPTTASSVEDALLLSLNWKGGVDQSFISGLLPSWTWTDIATELVDKGLAWMNPSSLRWEPREVYLAGNVRKKLRAAQLAADTDSYFASHVAALEAVIPVDLTASEIDGNLGAAWIPDDVVKQFVCTVLETDHIELQHTVQAASWKVSFTYGATNLVRESVHNRTTWGTSRVSGMELINDALNQVTTTVHDTMADGTSVVNSRETMVAREKLAEIREHFRKWLWLDDERAQRLVRLYNDEFNSTVLPEYDGSHLTFPWMSDALTPRKYQRDVIWRYLCGGNLLAAHCVGAGKTATAIIAHMEARRLGIFKKVVFVVPNHMLLQYASEFLRIYPAANLLCAAKEDLVGDRRRELLARIATGDWDGVIITHASFEKLQLSAAQTEDFISDELERLDEAIDEAWEDGDRSNAKRLEGFRKAITSKLDRLCHSVEKDKNIFFDELGIDCLVVDESQYAKALPVATRISRVAGLPNTVSKRALDLYAKVQYVQSKHGGKRGAMFTTATPITNSMAEMFTVLRFLSRETLREHDIDSFDAWAATFGKIVSSMEVTPDGGGFRLNNRFAQFVNLPELMRLFGAIADVKTREQIRLPVPEVEGGKAEIVVSQPSEAQRKLVQDLVRRAERIRQGGVKPNEDNMLAVTGEGRRGALDLRLVDPTAEDFAGSKVNMAVRNVFDIWEESKEQKLAQLVFCDLSTPKAVAFDVYNPVGQVKFLHLWPGQIPPGRTVRIVVHVPAAGLVSPA